MIVKKRERLKNKWKGEMLKNFKMAYQIRGLLARGQREMERQSLESQSPYGIVAQDSFIYPTNFEIMLWIYNDKIR